MPPLVSGAAPFGTFEASAPESVRPSGSLAPAPDFRCVPMVPFRLPRAAKGRAFVASALALGAAYTFTHSPVAAAATGAIVAMVSSIFKRSTSALRRNPGADAPISLLPWGIVISTPEEDRALRWSSARGVDLESVHEKHDGVPTTLYTIIRVKTERDEICGVTLGAVPLERLLHNWEAYGKEQHHVLARDLDGQKAVLADEPQVEQLLMAARAFTTSGEALRRLDLSPNSYRHGGGLQEEGVNELRRILSDREAKECDPRAFAALVVAELGAKELAPELEALTQCPHPIIAAVARYAALRLGVSVSRVGSVEEIEPFLFESDLARLRMA